MYYAVFITAFLTSCNSPTHFSSALPASNISEIQKHRETDDLEVRPDAHRKPSSIIVSAVGDFEESEQQSFNPKIVTIKIPEYQRETRILPITNRTTIQELELIHSVSRNRVVGARLSPSNTSATLSIARFLDQWPEKQHHVLFEQDKVDIIIAVDNSSSMDGEQEKLANSFKSLVEGLGETDWKIHITNTDPYETKCVSATISKPLPNAASFEAAQSAFGVAIRQGDQGSDMEMGMQKITYILSGSCPDAEIRNGKVGMLLLTDEDHCSGGTCANDHTYIGKNSSYRDVSYQRFGAWISRYHRFGLIANLDTTCSPMSDIASSLMYIIRDRRHLHSICESSYASFLKAFANDLATRFPENVFEMKSAIYEDSIHASTSRDGVTSKLQHVFDPDGNTITLQLEEPLDYPMQVELSYKKVGHNDPLEISFDTDSFNGDVSFREYNASTVLLTQDQDYTIPAPGILHLNGELFPRAGTVILHQDSAESVIAAMQLDPQAIEGSVRVLHYNYASYVQDLVDGFQIDRDRQQIIFDNAISHSDLAPYGAQSQQIVYVEYDFYSDPILNYPLSLQAPYVLEGVYDATNMDKLESASLDDGIISIKKIDSRPGRQIQIHTRTPESEVTFQFASQAKLLPSSEASVREICGEQVQMNWNFKSTSLEVVNCNPSQREGELAFVFEVQTVVHQLDLKEFVALDGCLGSEHLRLLWNGQDIDFSLVGCSEVSLLRSISNGKLEIQVYH